MYLKNISSLLAAGIGCSMDSIAERDFYTSLKVLKIFLNNNPLVYVIGSMKQVNQKIAQLELGLKRFDSSDVVSKESMVTV